MAHSDTVRSGIERLLLKNVGRALTREQIIEAARDPQTGAEPENWHQRLSELRTDYGYTIQTHRDDPKLKLGEYRLASAVRRPTAKKR